MAVRSRPNLLHLTVLKSETADVNAPTTSTFHPQCALSSAVKSCVHRCKLEFDSYATRVADVIAEVTVGLGARLDVFLQLKISEGIFNP